MMTVSRRRALAVIAGGAGLATLPGSAFADDPIQGLEVGLRQNPGGLTVRGRTDRNGVVTLTPPAPGTYNIYLPDTPNKVRLVIEHPPGHDTYTSDTTSPYDRVIMWSPAGTSVVFSFTVRPPARGESIAPAIIRALAHY